MGANDRDEFIQWLQGEPGLRRKSARDVNSRLNRARRYVDWTREDLSTEELLFRMSQHQDFVALEKSVQSQLRRAIKLYRNYASARSSQSLAH